MDDLLLKLSDELAQNAQGVREIEPGSDEYRHYWRGYATALDFAAGFLRGRDAVLRARSSVTVRGE